MMERQLSYSPEQDKAFAVLRANLPIYRSLMVDSLPTNLFETNYKAFSKKLISKESFPHDFWWVWNQSNGKAERWLNDKIRVTIQKFNPRKRAGYRDRKISYKLWLFRLDDSKGNHQMSFIWCEKGSDHSDDFDYYDFDAFTNHRDNDSCDDDGGGAGDNSPNNSNNSDQSGSPISPSQSPRDINLQITTSTTTAAVHGGGSSTSSTNSSDDHHHHSTVVAKSSTNIFSSSNIPLVSTSITTMTATDSSDISASMISSSTSSASITSLPPFLENYFLSSSENELNSLPSFVTIDSLSFLKEFVTVDIAKDLGWL